MMVSRCRTPWKLCLPSKSLALASSRAARARLEPAMRRMGIATVNVAEHLGVDFQTAGRLVRVRQAARMREVQAKLGRDVRLGKKAGAHVFKTGALPAMRHGTSIVGATVATMRKINKMAAKVSGKQRVPVRTLLGTR